MKTLAAPRTSRFTSRGTMRVVQVSFHRDAAARDARTLLGAWPTLTAVASAAQQAGADITVVQCAHSDERIIDHGINYDFIASSSRTRRRVIERVQSLKPALVHVQGLVAPIAMRHLTNALADIPVLVQDHGGVPPTGWRALVGRWGFEGIDAVAFTAEEQADAWKSQSVLRRDLPVFEVLESSTTFAPGSRELARTSTGIFGNPGMLWTGRLNENKDPLTSLAAFEIAAPCLPDARLWCCFPEAPLLGVVRARIAESPILRERVTLLGTRPPGEMENMFRAADFLVQTSHREGSGFSVIEALACGAVPLVTDVPSLRRIVGDAGALVPVGDTKALAAAMIDWSSRDRDALRAQARGRFQSALSFASVGHELRRAYERIVENGVVRRGKR